MTDIDVPDWVVAVADEAAAEFVESRTMSMYASLDDMRRDCAGHMLRAALSAWVVPADWQVRMHVLKTGDMVYDWRQTSKEQFDAADGQPHQGATLRCEYRTLYTLRQEKPE